MLIPGAREIPDPEAEMERLAAARDLTHTDAIYVPYCDGVITPKQIRELQDALNEVAAGKVIGKFIVIPPGSKVA